MVSIFPTVSSSSQEILPGTHFRLGQTASPDLLYFFHSAMLCTEPMT